MLYVVDGLFEQGRHMIIVERIDNVPSLPLPNDKPEVTKDSQLMRDGGLLHIDG